MKKQKVAQLYRANRSPYGCGYKIMNAALLNGIST
jgi:hypothetical protein